MSTWFDMTHHIHLQARQKGLDVYCPKLKVALNQGWTDSNQSIYTYDVWVNTMLRETRVQQHAYDRLASETGILGISSWRFNFPFNSRIFKSFVSDTVCLAMIIQVDEKEKRKRKRVKKKATTVFHQLVCFLCIKLYNFRPNSSPISSFNVFCCEWKSWSKSWKWFMRMR